MRSAGLRRFLVVLVAACTVFVSLASPASAQQSSDTVTKLGPGGARGYEPTDVKVVPGDGQLTVSWKVASRPGVDDDDIYHALRWSYIPGSYQNDGMPQFFRQILEDAPPLLPEHGIAIEPGTTSYTITGLPNRVVVGVHVRSFTDRTFAGEGHAGSSQWVRVKGPSTTPVADEVIFDSGAYTVAEGGTVSLGLTRHATSAANLDNALTFTLSTADGTAASTDYTTFAARSITMAAKASTASSTVVAASDDLVEEDETLTVAVSVPSESVFGAGKPSTATITITDDDRASAKIAFGTSAASTTQYTATVAEGVNGATLNVPVTVSHLPGASTTFAVEVLSGGTASEGSDYSIGTKSVTFGPTDTSKTKNVAITLTNDTEYELDETVKLRITAAADPVDDLGDHYARDAAGATALITVTSEDARSATKIYSVPSASSGTESGNAEITLTLGEATTAPLRFTVRATYTVTGKNQAVAADTGGFRSSTHTVAAGKSSDTITIAIPTDGAVEDPETFTVTVTTDDIRWSVDPDGSATSTVTINDNTRERAKIAFGTDAASTAKHTLTVAENGNPLVHVPVTVNAFGSRPVTFDVEVLDTSTATEGSDFRLTTKSVTFDVANTVTTRNVTLSLRNDNDWEENETVDLRIVPADVPANDLGDHFARHAAGATATITITSEETHFVAVSAPSLTVERDRTATYTVVLTDEPTDDVTVTPQLFSGRTRARVSGAVTFTSDNWSSPQQVTVTGVSDGAAVISHAVSSDDTNFTSSKAQQVSVTVTPPPAATKFYEITSALTAAEGADASLTVTLSEAAPVDMTFDVGYDFAATAVSAADTGSGRPSTVTVSQGSTTATLAVPLATDNLVESTEQLKLSIAPGAGVTREWGAKTAGADKATVSITDTTVAVEVDVVELAKTVSVDSNRNIALGEGAGSFTVPLKFAKATTEEVVLTISAQGTASRGFDYRVPSRITVASGATTASFTVNILEDKIHELSETFSLSLAVETPAAGYGVGAAGDVKVAISNNDTAGVQVSSDTVKVRAGSTATYTVKLASRPTHAVAIRPTSDDTDTAKVSGGNGGVAYFAPGAWNQPQTITVTGVKTGTATISHTVTSIDSFYPPNLSIDDVGVTVKTASAYAITSSATAAEGANAELTVTLYKDAPAGGLAFTVTPAYGTGTGKAAAGDLGTVPATVTVAANQRTATLRIPLARDALVEGDETFTVGIATSAQGWVADAGGAGTATVTVTDATRQVSLAASTYTVGESDSKVTVGLSVSGAHADTITATVTLGRSGDSATRNADYGGASATAQATFAPGVTSATLDIPISDDELVEGIETFTVTLSSVSAGHAVLATANSATVTITDDDASATVTVSQTSLSVPEWDTATRKSGEKSYTVVLNARPTADVTITPSSSAAAQASVSGPVTFTPAEWNTPKTITVTGKQNGAATITHSVTSDDARFAALTPASVAVTVTPYANTYALSDITVPEGAERSLMITLGAVAPTGGLVFELAAVFDTPGPGKAQPADLSPNFARRIARVTVPSGQNTGSAAIAAIASDLLGEGNETFTVTVTGVTGNGAAVPAWVREPGSPKTSSGAAAATVTITDGLDSKPYSVDGRGRIAFGTNAASTERYAVTVAENVSTGTLSVPVAVSHLPVATTTFTITDAGTGTATAYTDAINPGDYRIADTTVTFGPDDISKTKNIVITLTDDSDAELPETILLSIAPAGAQATGPGRHYVRHASGAAATVTIDSDELPTGFTKTYAIASAATAAEGTDAELTVTLGEAAPQGGVTFSVTYDYSVSNAWSGDTGTTPATFTVKAGETTGTLRVPIVHDNGEDGTETFTVTIAATTSGWVKAPSGTATATVTITDATEMVSFAATGYTVIEGESANVVVTRTGPTTRAATVTVTAFGFGAHRGLSYGLKTVEIPVGAQSAAAVFSTTDNESPEGVGRIFLTMRTDALGFVASRGFSYIYIQDDDGADYTTTYTVESSVDADEGNDARLAITLGEAVHSDGLSFRVYYDYSADSATAADLGDAPTTLDVAAGATQATLAIPIVGDGVAESNETFVVSITPVSNDFDWALAPAGSAAATVTIVGQASSANQAPTVASAIADVELVNETATADVSLSGVFSDGDNDSLTVTAASSATATATVSVAADYSKLTVMAKARGTATVTVTADDGNGGTVSDTFTVKVKAAPTVASALADLDLEVGADSTVSLAGVFTDADGDTLTVTTANDAETVVSLFTPVQNDLPLLALEAGTATITVTAEDSDGNTVSDSFDVTVTQAPQAQQSSDSPSLTLSWLPGDTRVLESDKDQSGEVAVTLSSPAGDSGVVVYLTPGDVSAAIWRADYTFSPTAVYIEPGARHGFVTLTIKGDDLAESSETVVLTASADGYQDAAPLRIEIVDDDAVGTGGTDDTDDGTVVEEETAVVPAAPTALTATVGAGQVMVRWTAPAGTLSGYDVHYTTASSVVGDDVPLTAGSDPATGWVDAGHSGLTTQHTISTQAPGVPKLLIGDMSYRVRVRARSSAGASVWAHTSVDSSPSDVSVPLPPPGPVSDVTATATEDTETATWSVTVGWTAPAGDPAPTGYIVQIRPLKSGTGSARTKRPSADATSVTFADVPHGTYQVWVRAQNSGAKSARVEFETEGEGLLVGEQVDKKPGKVSNVAVAGTQFNEDGTVDITLTWNAPPRPATRYIVYIEPAEGEGGTTKIVKAPDHKQGGNAANPQPATVFRGLRPGTGYKFWVRAENLNGKSSRVRLDDYTTPELPPQSPPPPSA